MMEIARWLMRLWKRHSGDDDRLSVQRERERRVRRLTGESTQIREATAQLRHDLVERQSRIMRDLEYLRRGNSEPRD